jgi:hypothetical protein
MAALAGAGTITYFAGDGSALVASASGPALVFLQSVPAQSSAGNLAWALALTDPRNGNAPTGAFRCSTQAAQTLDGSIVIPPASTLADARQPSGLSRGY